MRIPLIFEHLFYKYFFLSVCRSGYKSPKCKNIEVWFSWPLIKFKVYFFLCLFLPYMSIYSINFVCWSIGQATKGRNVITWKHNLLNPKNKNKNLVISLHIPLILKHLIYEYFHLLVRLQKVKSVKTCKCNFLDPHFNFI